MSNNEAIAKLQEELRGLDQDKAFAEIDREHYWSEHQRISKAISKLRESQPSNFKSPEPTGTPEERQLVNLKKEMGRNIDALRNRMGSKWCFDAINTLKHTHHISQMLTFYAGWQQEVENKRKADMYLPDLNAKPKPVTRYDKAA